MWDGDHLVEEVGDSGIEVRAGLPHLLAATRAGEESTGRTGAEALPSGYVDVLELRLTLKPDKLGISYNEWLPPNSWRRDPETLWTAVGSVFRDAEGRVVVLWR